MGEVVPEETFTYSHPSYHQPNKKSQSNLEELCCRPPQQRITMPQNPNCYNRMPHIHPQNCSFHSTIFPHLIHPPVNRLIDRWSRRQLCSNTCLRSIVCIVTQLKKTIYFCGRPLQMAPYFMSSLFSTVMGDCLWYTSLHTSAQLVGRQNIIDLACEIHGQQITKIHFQEI